MEIFRAFFGRREDGVWQIQSLKSLPLDPANGGDEGFYPVKDDVFMADQLLFGTIKSVMGLSIVPIVAHVPGESVLRCLGTGFFISCSGLLVTAAHVITDPLERRYGGIKEIEDQTWDLGNLKLGVMIPTNPLTGAQGYVFRGIEWASFLAERALNPLPIRDVDLKLTADIALCKVEPLADKVPYQPLPIIQPGLRGIGVDVGKTATAVGYAGMKDVQLEPVQQDVIAGDFSFDLHVSRGEIKERFPDNMETKQVPTPGACFSASFKLPGGMSGSPIFDDERIYVHGVVSKGWEDED